MQLFLRVVAKARKMSPRRTRQSTPGVKASQNAKTSQREGAVRLRNCRGRQNGRVALPPFGPRHVHLETCKKRAPERVQHV